MLVALFRLQTMKNIAVTRKRLTSSKNKRCHLRRCQGKATETEKGYGGSEDAREATT